VYAVNNGFLDQVPVTAVVAWEKAMHEHMSTLEKELLISLEKGWDDDIEAALKKSLHSFGSSHKHEA
jgi:F-type H+-transporting ATPase subunit alpha